MATAAEIAALITAGMQGPTGPDDVGLHTGTILSWDEVSQVNSVLVNNAVVDNVRTVQGGIGTLYSPGDTVMIVRKQTQYFVLGKIAAPGGNNANQIKYAEISANEATASTTYTDLATFGPQLTINIGSGRRCLLLVGVRTNVAGTASNQYIGGSATVNVTGASNIPIVGTTSCGVLAQTTPIVGIATSVVRSFVLTAANGLNPGTNIFTMQYKSNLASPTCSFAERNITVIPF